MTTTTAANHSAPNEHFFVFVDRFSLFIFNKKFLSSSLLFFHSFLVLVSGKVILIQANDFEYT